MSGSRQVWLYRLAGLLLLSILLCGLPVRARQTESSGAASDAQLAVQETTSAASINGRVVDPTGMGISGATVKLTGNGEASSQEAVSGNDGQFVFSHVAPGPFHLTITSAGFAAQEFSGNLQHAENFMVPQITLPVAAVITEVRVSPPQIEIAEEQIKEEEKQRALGFIPNYYVTYVPNAVPLAPRQKFELAWKMMVDPVTFGITGAIAGIQQANNDFSGYGQGADGYAKRYGAAYADAAIGTFIGGAILPSLWHQDPRYFYRGTGSKKSRLWYAVSRTVICKGDNGKWQVDYSGLLGGLAAGGISNLYYPPKDRDAGLTFQNFAIGLAASAAGNVLQEFVIKKLTPNLSSHDPNNNNGNSGKTHNLVERVFGSLIHEGD